MKNYILLNLSEYKAKHACIEWVMYMLVKLRGDEPKRELAQMIDSWLEDIDTYSDDWKIRRNVINGIIQFLSNKDTIIRFNKTCINNIYQSSEDYKYMKFRYDEKPPEHYRFFMVNLSDKTQLRKITFQYKDQIIKIEDKGWGNERCSTRI